jgi:hypothetical protein
MKQDAASVALERYYSLSDFDRPQTEDDYKAFVYKTVLAFMGTEARRYGIEHAGDDGARTAAKAMDRSEDDDVLDQIAWQRKTVADQEQKLFVKDTLNLMSELPPDLRRMAEKMGGGANVLECAKEMKLNIEDAISMQSAVRFLVNAFDEGY